MAGESPESPPGPDVGTTGAARASFRIVAFAQNYWERGWVNRQQILTRLAKSHGILYTNAPWFAWERSHPEFRAAPLFGRFDLDHGVCLDRSPRLLLRWPRCRTYDTVVRRVACRRWRRKSRNLGSGPLVAYVFHPSFYPLVADLSPDLLVYHAYDCFRHTPGWNPSSARNETTMLERADLVIATSEMIRSELRSTVDRPVRVLPNGAAYAEFRRAAEEGVAEPSDLASIPHPRIGYTGHLNQKVDFSLIAELAERRPEWQLVLVGALGRADTHMERDLQTCRTRPNIHFLGEKPHREIPGYVTHLDVTTMWYRTSEGWWSKGGYPLKLHEYLAAGKPVVSSALPTVLEFGGVLEAPTDTGGWVAAIERALRGEGRGSVAERRAVAEQHDWWKLVRKLDGWLRDLPLRARP